MEFNIQSYSGINGEIYGIRCGVHTLQLAILDALKIHEKSLAIIRKVVKELRSTTNIQILKNAKLKTPLLDCPNRWSSTFKMLETLVDYKSQYINVMKDIPNIPQITTIQMEKLTELRDALSPAKFKSSELTLADFYTEWLKCKVETRKIQNSLAKTIVTKMEEREKKLFDNIILTASIFLDPRIQSLLSPTEKIKAKTHLVSVFERIELIKETTIVENVNISLSQDNDSDDLDNYISQLSRSNINYTFRVTPNITAIVEGFENTPRLPHKTSILEYWEKKKEESPELFALAKVVFGVPATQVSVERSFSSLKFILSDMRGNLSKEMLENILMIKLNKNFEI